jgi:RHS repeat-associated protein
VYDASYTARGSSSYAWTQGFQGMFFDATSGLDKSRGRPGYSPTLGRWVTTDPSQYSAGDVNLFRFVGNNPTNGIDPSGLVWVPTGGRMIAPVTQGPRYSIVSGYTHHLTGNPVLPYNRPSPFGRYVDYTVAPPPPHPLAPLFRWVADYDHNALVRREFTDPAPVVYYTEEIWINGAVPVPVPVPVPGQPPVPITITEPCPSPGKRPGFWDMPEDPLYEIGKGAAAGTLIFVGAYTVWAWGPPVAGGQL